MSHTANLVTPIIVLGGGGHAKVLIAALQTMGREIIGYSSQEQKAESVLGVSRLGGDAEVLEIPTTDVHLVNGIGSIGSTTLRKSVYEKFKDRGYVFESVIHPAAVLAADVQLEEGAQVMAGAVIQPGTRIGANSVINTSASVDHDCFVGSHAHISPGVVLCGRVRIGEGAHIGAGSTVIQGRSIGAGSTVGAGAVVISDVPPNVTVLGVPARVSTLPRNASGL